MESTTNARVEASDTAHVIQSPIAGRVVEANLSLGRRVRSGDVLVQLDDAAERFELREQQARHDALGQQRTTLVAEIDAERRAISESENALSALSRESSARRDELLAVARSSADRERRYAQLSRSGAVPEIEGIAAHENAVQTGAAVNVAIASAQRQRRDLRAAIMERRARTAELAHDLAQAEGDIAMSEAAIARLDYRISLSAIRAPVDGVLGDIAPIQTGTFLPAASPIGSVVPPSALHVVAWFRLQEVVGRLRPGQHARMRFDAYPPAEYGVLDVQVRSVATESRDDRIRVDLAIRPAAGFTIPLQHGLSGTVEVEVERLSPLDLLQRLIGKWLHTPVREPAAAPREGT